MNAAFGLRSAAGFAAAFLGAAAGFLAAAADFAAGDFFGAVAINSLLHKFLGWSFDRFEKLLHCVTSRIANSGVVFIVMQVFFTSFL
ncbi:hypothetical protein [Undibacterium rugosum]|uniref:hypothetical protein n=1 Tax=Undibacterium rugosum TaxID=2762291 RepID=UPI0038B6B04F